ncbi:MAG: hypothetical protein H6729_02895 [Deltaproteobacteria bacterium]|nr:hypothetical protein [Deltaproteobacteria bacterium]
MRALRSRIEGLRAVEHAQKDGMEVYVRSGQLFLQVEIRRDHMNLDLWLPAERIEEARASGLARTHPFMAEAIKVRFERAEDLTKVASWLEESHRYAEVRAKKAARDALKRERAQAESGGNTAEPMTESTGTAAASASAKTTASVDEDGSTTTDSKSRRAASVAPGGSAQDAAKNAAPARAKSRSRSGAGSRSESAGSGSTGSGSRASRGSTNAVRSSASNASSEPAKRGASEANRRRSTSTSAASTRARSGSRTRS